MSEKNPPVVAVIDYGLGNIFSVLHASRHVGLNPYVTSDREHILKADAIILPGVGAFSNAMDNLRKLDLIGVIKDCIGMGKPCLGICLGMQLLLTESEEFGRHEGLDIIKGSVKKFQPYRDEKVPQVGWNKVYYPFGKDAAAWGRTPLATTHNGEYMYFVHSYFTVPSDNSVVLAETEYAGIRYCSAISWKNIFAFQFHPERSAAKGLAIYKSWSENLKLLKEDK